MHSNDIPGDMLCWAPVGFSTCFQRACATFRIIGTDREISYCPKHRAEAEKDPNLERIAQWKISPNR